MKRMNPKGRLTLFGILLIAISMVAYSSHVWSEEAEKHEHFGSHGGEMRMTDKFHVELAVKDHGIEVYLLDINQKPLPVKEDMSGTVSLTFKDRTEKKLSLVKALHGGQIRKVDDIFAELVIKHEGIDIYLLDKTQKPIPISADFSGSISIKLSDEDRKVSLEPVVKVKKDDVPHIKAPIELPDVETFEAQVNLNLSKLGKKAFKFKYKAEHHAGEQEATEHHGEEQEAEHHGGEHEETEHQFLSHFEVPIDLSKVDMLRILVSADLGKLGEKAGEKQLNLRFNYRKHKEEKHEEEHEGHHD